MRGRSSLLALTWLAFFMADVRDGLGPFLATYLQQAKVRQELSRAPHTTAQLFSSTTGVGLDEAEKVFGEWLRQALEHPAG